MTPKDLEKKYKTAIRKKNPRSGASWQRVKEVTGPKESGSAYWDHVQSQSAPSEDGEHRENVEANPDQMGFKAKGDIQSMILSAEHSQEIQARVRKLLDLAKQLLTEQQYNVFVMLAVKEPHLTERETAKVLSITPGRVHQLWAKARLKLQRAYEQRTA